MNLPEIIIRIDDGAEFILDENAKTYSLKSFLNDKQKGHLVLEYSYETLMETHKGNFKVADGTENLELMRKNWLRKFGIKNSCGDDGEVCGR